MKAVLSVDLGATSGRAIVVYLEEGKLILDEVLRFSNIPVQRRGLLCWDTELIFSKILESIRIATRTYDILSVGIDTWGVDYAWLDNRGNLLSLPVHYRDTRTVDILDIVSTITPLEDIYYKTGNQLMEINTLFQLLAHRKDALENYCRGCRLLMMPDYFNYLLTGEFAVEKSIASTTQLVDSSKGSWHKEILSLFDIDETLLPSIVNSGHILGNIKEEFGVGTIKVVNVCEHDTASAIASLPLQDDLLYISSGTWSLVGTVLQEPLINQKSLNYHFTNEIGYNDSVTFLKNCTGLWIVEELRREYEMNGQIFGYDDIQRMVQAENVDAFIFDSNAPEFSKPGEMIQKIQDYASKISQRIPLKPSEIFKSAYISLVNKYRETIEELEDLTGKRYSVIYLIGGGSKSSYYSQLIATMTERKVITGLSEATGIGNALVQMIALGLISGMEKAQEIIKESFDIKVYFPN